MKKILIVDALGLFFKSYYALEKTGLKKSDGFPVFAIYGFFKSFFKAIRELSPTHFIIVSDSKGKSFRNEIFSDYKANRKEAPESLTMQLEYLLELIERIKLPFLARKGFEADDIIATIARDISKKDAQIFILSSDKDLCQLVDDHIFAVHSPISLSGAFKILGKAEVVEKFGVNPKQVLDYLSIVGDSSDNIPGVAGVGPKGAQELLEQFETLNHIYEHLDDLKPKLKEKLIESKEKAFLSYQLATLESVPLITPVTYWVEINSAMISALKYEFEELEFHNLNEMSVLQSLLKEDYAIENKEKSVLTKTIKKGEYLGLYEEEEVLKLLEEIKTRKKFVFDTETTSLNINDCELLGVSIALEPYKAYYIPITTSDDMFAKGISLEWFITHFEPIFKDPLILKIGHHLKYDYRVLKKYLKDVTGLYFDTMIAAFLIEPDSKRYGMDHLALKYLGYQTISYKDLVTSKIGTLKDVELDKVVEYASEDADITYRLYELFEEQIHHLNLHSIFEHIEMPLIPVLADMESVGIEIDQHYFLGLKKELENYIDLLVKEIYHMSGKEFNLNSPKQMSEVLYNELKIAPEGGFKSQKRSTSEDVLLTMTHHPIISKILEYRKYFKLYSTYVTPFSTYQGSLNHKENERIQTSFNQAGAATGRLASSDPNLQNIPTRDSFGKKIREGFVAKKGSIFLGLDYSQIELRILAHYAQDQFLIDAFFNDQDIHLMTASKIFNKKIEEIGDQERSLAKTINFGIIYGMGAKKLAHEINISTKAAKEFIEKYFDIFKGVKEFIDRTKIEVRKEEYVTTLLGRKRFFYGINQSEEYLSVMNERMAFNTVIQGSCADIMKKCMIEIHSMLKNEDSIDLLLQIHDELIFEVKEEKLAKYTNLIKHKMEEIVALSIPLKVSLNVGRDWGKLK